MNPMNEDLPTAKTTALGPHVTAAGACAKWQADPEGVKILDVRPPEEHYFIGHPPMAWKIQLARSAQLHLGGRSRNSPVQPWWRVGFEIVEFPYPDDGYGEPKMRVPFENPTGPWLARDPKHDRSVRPLEAALEKGLVDAI